MAPKKKKSRAAKPAQQSDTATWLKKETPYQRKALETASRHFDRSDALDVHTLEAMYGRESNFGQMRGKRNSDGYVGEFQMGKKEAREMGLRVSEENDERFDLNASSSAAAKYLKVIDDRFKSGKASVAIDDPEERKKFDLAAYNGGPARIARAQKLARQAGNDPMKWDEVKKYLEKAGATAKTAKQAREYVDRVSEYERVFDKKSKANADEKFKKGRPIDPYPSGGHWITKDGRHILIKD